MVNRLSSSEVMVVACLLTISVLCFFFPLVSITMPILGQQTISGYDVVSRRNDFEDQTSKQISAIENLEADDANSASSTTQKLSSAGHTSLPLSMEFAPLIPLEILAAFALAALSLLGCFQSLALTKVGSGIGALLAALAAIHLTILNSDLHIQIEHLVRTSTNQDGSNPFAVLGQQLALVVSNSVKLEPGLALYALVGALAMTCALCQTRVLAKVAANGPPLGETPETESGEKRVALLLLMIAGTILLLVAGTFLYEGAQPPAQNAAISKSASPPQLPDATASPQVEAPLDSQPYSVYKNSRYGFSCLRPTSFTPGIDPVNGDGLSFESIDGKANLSLSGMNNSGDTVETLFNARLQNIAKPITYSKLARDWYVLSWLDDDRVKYEKTWVGTGSVNYFSFAYPVEDRPIYDSVLPVLVKSFEPGDLSQSW